MTEPGSAPVRYARNGEVRIAFEDLGGAGGDPLLLVMGLGVSRFWWPRGLVDELVRRGFHGAAFDQRDAGDSTHFPDTGTRSPVAAVLRGRSAAYWRSLVSSICHISPWFGTCRRPNSTR